MPMSQQIADQPAVVRNFARSLAVTDPRGLDDGLVVSHHVDQAHETVVEHGKLLPTECADLLGR